MLTKRPGVVRMSNATLSQSLHQNIRVELAHKIDGNTETLSKQQHSRQYLFTA